MTARRKPSTRRATSAATDASGNPTLIVSTDGQYSYVGRRVVDFDPAGNLILDSFNPAISGVYAADEAGVLAVTGDATLDEAIATSDKASAVKQLVEAIETTVLEVSGTNFFGEHDVFINGERGDVRQQETISAVWRNTSPSSSRWMTIRRTTSTCQTRRSSWTAGSSTSS